jgi:uncharacterized protein YjdB
MNGSYTHYTHLLYQALANNDVAQAWQHYHNIKPSNANQTANQEVNHIILATTDTLHSTTYPLDKQQTKTLTHIALQNPHRTGRSSNKSKGNTGAGHRRPTGNICKL